MMNSLSPVIPRSVGEALPVGSWNQVDSAVRVLREMGLPISPWLIGPVLLSYDIPPRPYAGLSPQLDESTAINVAAAVLRMRGIPHDTDFNASPVAADLFVKSMTALRKRELVTPVIDPLSNTGTVIDYRFGLAEIYSDIKDPTRRFDSLLAAQSLLDPYNVNRSELDFYCRVRPAFGRILPLITLSVYDVAEVVPAPRPAYQASDSAAWKLICAIQHHLDQLDDIVQDQWNTVLGSDQVSIEIVRRFAERFLFSGSSAVVVQALLNQRPEFGDRFRWLASPLTLEITRRKIDSVRDVVDRHCVDIDRLPALRDLFRRGDEMPPLVLAASETSLRSLALAVDGLQRIRVVGPMNTDDYGFGRFSKFWYNTGFGRERPFVGQVSDFLAAAMNFPIGRHMSEFQPVIKGKIENTLLELAFAARDFRAAFDLPGHNFPLRADLQSAFVNLDRYLEFRRVGG